MKIKQPKLVQTEMDTFENCLKCENWYGRRIEKSPISAIEIEDVIIDSCYFYKVDFSDIKLSGVDIVDCVFEECILAGNEITDRAMQRTIFKKCNLMGANFFDCGFKDVQFLECQAKYINLSGDSFKNCCFISCDLSEGRWHNLSLMEITIDKSMLRSLEVVKTSAGGVDFSTSDIEGISIDAQCLKGARVNINQAVMLVELLGVEIVSL